MGLVNEQQGGAKSLIRVSCNELAMGTLLPMARVGNEAHPTCQDHCAEGVQMGCWHLKGHDYKFVGHQAGEEARLGGQRQEAQPCLPMAVPLTPPYDQDHLVRGSLVPTLHSCDSEGCHERAGDPFVGACCQR